MKTIEVLLPITVPDSEFCVEYKDKINICKYFNFGECLNKFTPEYHQKTGNFKKPQECRSLVWKIT
jgi:hypothetical protein